MEFEGENVHLLLGHKTILDSNSCGGPLQVYGLLTSRCLFYGRAPPALSALVASVGKLISHGQMHNFMMMCPWASSPLPSLLRHQSGSNRQIFQVSMPRANVGGEDFFSADICEKSPEMEGSICCKIK